MIWTLLLAIVILVNQRMLCFPPSLWLNPLNSTRLIPKNCNTLMNPDVELGAKQFANETSQVFFPKSTSNQTGKNEISEDYHYFLFNVVVIGLIFPLGLTSISLALSEFWIPTLQNSGLVRRLKSSGSLQIDILKAFAVVLFFLIFLVYCMPIGISISQLLSNCKTHVIFNLTLWVVLPVVFALSWIFLKKMGVVDGKAQTGQNDLGMKRGNIGLVLAIFGMLIFCGVAVLGFLTHIGPIDASCSIFLHPIVTVITLFAIACVIVLAVAYIVMSIRRQMNRSKTKSKGGKNKDLEIRGNTLSHDNYRDGQDALVNKEGKYN